LAGTAFKLGAAATTAAHRIVYNQATGELFYDADGTARRRRSSSRSSPIRRS
jgi:Ca2+-binding RTX toxin-like protein